MSDVVSSIDGALECETKRFPAEILLSIAWGESRFISKTVTGVACGPMQTIARDSHGVFDRALCQSLTTPTIGYCEGVHELEAWEADAWTHGELNLVLLGYAAGYGGFTNPHNPKRAWPAWVLGRARQLGYQKELL